MPTEKPRVTFTISEEKLAELELYRYENKIKNQTQAILSLIDKGLSALEANKVAEPIKNSPSTAEAAPGMDGAHGMSLRERIRINLVSAMERTNINQVQLAEKLGISKGTVNNWARGNNSPDVDMVPRICEVLGISILDLYSPTKFEHQERIKKPPTQPRLHQGRMSCS